MCRSVGSRMRDPEIPFQALRTLDSRKAQPGGFGQAFDKAFSRVASSRIGKPGMSSGTVGFMVSDAVIVDAGRRLAAAACSPARVLLFGSRARGDAHEDSDLDFLVIEQHVDSKLNEMVRLRDALPPLAVPVDVVVVSEEEVARRKTVPSTLVHRALREGRVLVSA